MHTPSSTRNSSPAYSNGLIEAVLFTKNGKRDFRPWIFFLSIRYCERGAQIAIRSVSSFLMLSTDSLFDKNKRPLPDLFGWSLWFAICIPCKNGPAPTGTYRNWLVTYITFQRQRALPRAPLKADVGRYSILYTCCDLLKRDSWAWQTAVKWHYRCEQSQLGEDCFKYLYTTDLYHFSL